MQKFSDPFTVIVDANILGCSLKRNILLSLADSGFFRPLWSQRILDETEKTITKITKGQANSSEQVNRIKIAFPESLVTNYEDLESSLELHDDPQDKHVLAAAIKSNASLIVTENVRHFPNKYINSFDLQAIKADEFFADILDLDTSTFFSIKEMRQRFISLQCRPPN